MKCARLVLVAVCLAACTLGHSAFVLNLHSACLKCLCEAATSCNLSLGCSKGYCGPFKVSRVFWVDGGKHVLPEDDPERAGAYEDCARQYNCARRITQNYLGKFAKDCNGDGVINCDDYSMIHFNGGYSCETPINQTDHFKRYSACRPPQDGEAALLLRRGSFK